MADFVVGCREGCGGWVRAEVLRINSLTDVKVLLIDFGCTRKLGVELLRQLPDDPLYRTPGLVVRSSLLGLEQPSPGAAWPRHICQRLKELVHTAMEHGQGALLGEFRKEGDRWRVLLVDTASTDAPEGININKVVAEEVARSSPSERGAKVKELLESIASMAVVQQEQVVTVLQDCLQKLQDLGKISQGSSRDQEVGTGVTVVEHRLDTGEEEDTLHTLQLAGEEQRWCSGREVAILLPTWGGRDLLARMLKVKRVLLQERLLTRRGQEEMFRTLAKAGVRGTCESEEELLLYRLEDLPVILKLFRVPGTLGPILEAVQKLLVKME